MEEIYQKLAEKLNAFPHGFPPAENRLDLTILKWVFSPAEAEIALVLPVEPEAAASISKRLNRAISETELILNQMVEKMQIFVFEAAGTPLYFLPPYYPGFHDLQVNRKDKTKAELRRYAQWFDEYYPQLIKITGYHKPSLTRVVPVSTAIDYENKIYRLDDVKRIINEAKCILLMDCVCRKEKALLGRACDHSVETCMMFSDQENMFSKWPVGRIISSKEAMAVAAKCEEEGLVHCTYNANETGVTAICACCSCCSIFLSGLAKYNAPYIVAQSRFVARIDPALCTQCGICATERCPMNAIDAGAIYQVKPERCIGCGVCLSTCPANAIGLVARPEADAEMDKIPDNLVDWGTQRAAERWK